MSRFKLVNLIDKLFITIACFFITYAWINFYIRDLSSTFILSVIFSLAFTYVLFFFLERKKDKKINSSKLDETINKNFLAFRLMPTKEKLTLLNKVISQNHETKQTTKGIFYKKENLTHCIIVATKIQNLTQEDLINLIENLNQKINCIEIICNQFSSNINAEFINNLKIVFIDKQKLYNDYFLKYNIYPDTSILNEKNLKINWKIIFKNFLQEKKAKRYFVLGLVLIFSSIILPLKIYYLIFGTGFLVCSILCKILPKLKH